GRRSFGAPIQSDRSRLSPTYRAISQDWPRYPRYREPPELTPPALPTAERRQTPMDRSPGASLWTRRRVLKVGVAIAVGGGTALAAVIAAFEQRSPTAASTAPPSPGPGPVGHRYRSRPDISPPFVAIAAGSGAAP